MSLLEKDGFDVSDWSNFKGKHPAANSRYCYNWSFEQAGEKVAVCLWYSRLSVQHGRISRRLKPWKTRGAASLSNVIWKRRNNDVLMSLRLAYEQQLPVTIILLAGQEFEEVKSKVRLRELDEVKWAVTEYDFKTNECLIVRGAKPPSTNFSVTDPTDAWFEGNTRRAYVLHRRREWRARRAKIEDVLQRRKGKLICEVPRCGFDFKKRYGQLGEGFAEVHHLDKLSSAPKEGREVRLDRLAVVCANCNRMIHLGGQCRDMKGLIP
jgi:predicted HNH restriction endonuclease